MEKALSPALCPAFDYFIALDGNGLNGFEGLGGVARLRCQPDQDRYQISVRYFSGLAGGHATQLNREGTIGFLGNLSQTLLFYDPRTLAELDRFSTLRFRAPQVIYESQTHVVWLDQRSFVTAVGPSFLRFSLDDLAHPEELGPHGVTLPHAVKRSPSGRYLFYGAMDHDAHGYANQAGIFDLTTGKARVVRLPATVWHLGIHRTRDVFCAPTQRCAPQAGEFGEYTIAHLKNYLFEIDGESGTVLRHAALAKDLPASLTSDVVVTDDHVCYNACASSALVRVDLATFSRVEFFDERPGLWQGLAAWRSGWSNLVESFARAPVLRNTHVLLQALRATRMSPLDGSYGLQLSPDDRYLLSAHRGLNQVIVYRYPQMEVVRRIDFPPIQRFLPEHFGPLADPRLGFHHTALSTRTVGGGPAA